MTIIGAEVYDDGILVWSDMLVRHEREKLQIEPIPKVTVLDRDVVLGVAGSDPQGGLGNALRGWRESENVDAFMAAIADDGDERRDYLLARSDGSLFTLAADEHDWRDRTQSRFAWIGDQHARDELMPFGLLQPLEADDADMAEVVSEAWALIRASRVVREAPTETVGGLLVTVFLDPQRGFQFRSANVIGPKVLGLNRSEHDLSNLHGVLRALLSSGDELAYRIRDLGSTPAAFQIDLATTSQRAIVIYELDEGGYAGRAHQVVDGELIALR